MAPWMMQMQQQIELPVLVVTSPKETKVSGANVILSGIFDKKPWQHKYDFSFIG
jgi:hypothetical protein